jgi:Mn-containing catalase
VYENLMQFTDDPMVKETLGFLMTREIAHLQMFEAALATIQPNSPPAIRQGDPRYSNVYFNMSNGTESYRGPWNEGKSPDMQEEWEYIENPVEYVYKTKGLTDKKITGTKRTADSTMKKEKELSKIRSKEIKSSVPKGKMQWSDYSHT